MTFNPEELRLMAGLGQQEQKEYMDNLYYKATPMSKQTIKALKQCVDDLEPSDFKQKMYELSEQKENYERVLFNRRPENIQLMRRYTKQMDERRRARAEEASKSTKIHEEGGVFSKFVSVFKWQWNPFARHKQIRQQEEQELIDENQQIKKTA